MNSPVPTGSTTSSGSHAGLRRWLRKPMFLSRGKRPEPLPIRLGRKRIFIVPTGFGAGFAMILVVMLLGALNYSNNAALLLAALLGAATTGSMLAAFRALNGLHLDAVRSVTARAGELMPVVLEANGDGRSRHALYLHIAGQVSSFDIPAHRPQILQLQLPTSRRGWIAMPRLRVHTTWPFGMFRAWAWLHPDQRFVVYPQAEAEGPPPPAQVSASQEQRPQPNHGDQLSSLRAYRDGDPMKQVAWKASARHDNLLVREFEGYTKRQPWLLSWADTAPLDHEARIARLTRWVDAARATQARWTLCLPEDVLGPDQGDEHYHQCMRALALMP